jgi:hypothetical protein
MPFPRRYKKKARSSFGRYSCYSYKRKEPKQSHDDIPPFLKQKSKSFSQSIQLGTGNNYRTFTMPLDDGPHRWVSGVTISSTVSSTSFVPYTLSYFLLEMGAVSTTEVWVSGVPDFFISTTSGFHPRTSRLVTTVTKKTRVLRGSICGPGTVQATSSKVDFYGKINSWSGVSRNGTRIPDKRYALCLVMQSHFDQDVVGAMNVYVDSIMHYRTSEES